MGFLVSSNEDRCSKIRRDALKGLLLDVVKNGFAPVLSRNSMATLLKKRVKRCLLTTKFSSVTNYFVDRRPPTGRHLGNPFAGLKSTGISKKKKTARKALRYLVVLIHFEIEMEDAMTGCTTI